MREASSGAVVLVLVRGLVILTASSVSSPCPHSEGMRLHSWDEENSKSMQLYLLLESKGEIEQENSEKRKSFPQCFSHLKKK